MEATDSTKAIVAENNMRQRIRQSCLQWWIRAIDITPEYLREKGVLDIKQVMDVVVKLYVSSMVLICGNYKVTVESS